MTRQSANPSGLPAISIFIAAVGVTWTFLILEWFVKSGFQLDISQVSVARTLLALVVSGLGIGLVSGGISFFLGRLKPVPHLETAMAISLLLFLWMYSVVGNGPVGIKLSAAAGFGVLVFILVITVLKAVSKFVPTPGGWWLLTASLLAVALLLSVINAVDFTGTAISIGAVISAAVLIFRGLQSPSSSVLYGALSIVIIMGGSAVLGNRIPVVSADTATIAPDGASVLLVSIDTLRADHVGAYGYTSANTPVMDGLASEGVLFRQTVSPNVYTGPSHSSILTGLYPETHGVYVNLMRLPDSIPTLADILRRNGYVTGAFVSGYTTLDSAVGLPSRFNAFNDDIRAFSWLPEQAEKVAVLNIATKFVKILGWGDGETGQAYRMGEFTADKAIEWLDRNGGRPFFMWTHFFDPHVPYRPPAKYLKAGYEKSKGVSGNWYELNASKRMEIASSPGKVAEMIALYDGEIAYADEQLGRIVAAARRAAPDQRLLIVVTSDHGEAMGEHGLFWFRYLYDPTLLVPLIIVPVDSSHDLVQEVQTQVRLIDVVPTILELLGLDSAEQFDGSSLVGLMSGADKESPGPAFSGLYTTPEEYALERHSIRQDNWKLIEVSSGWGGGGAVKYMEEAQELYNLDADPLEVENLVDLQEPVLDTLTKKLNDHRSPSQKPELHLTPEERERLRSLGYVH